ncbi:MAG: phytanoyl-CoA dioxygenase family protein [Candidatus Latescibacterota bacterium]|nr:phytanoyl-CoA dioxygenase family protein [Candidatus Latescibacterota bacterium]
MRLTAEQRAHYECHGYVLIEGGLHAGDLAPVIAAYETFIDAQARRLHDAGTVSQLFEEEPFDRRLVCLCEEDASIYDHIDLMYCRLRGVFEFLRNPRLLDLVEGVVGPEIICSPIQHARAKLPESLLDPSRAVDDEAADRLRAMIGENVAPWHQDAQVHLEVADPHPIVTVWIPLVDATPDNGCLQLIPDVHRQRTVYWSDGFGVSDRQLPTGDIVTLPMRAGDVLLMNKLIPHRSTPNRTDGIRWSLDLRYQRTGTPTGRDFYPVFVARSHADPESELTDYDGWRSRWEQAVADIPPPERPGRQDRPTEPRPLEIQP